MLVRYTVTYDCHIDWLLLGIMLEFSGRLSLLSNVLTQSCSKVTSMNYLLILSCDLDERSEKSNPITIFGTGVVLLCHSYVDYFQVGWFILRSDRSSIHSPSLLAEELQTLCAQRFVLLSWANWKQNSLSRQLRAHSRSRASWILAYVMLWSSKSWVVSWNVSPAEFPEVAVSRWLITTK